MFLVFLRFSGGKDRAPELMAAHKAWIAHGMERGVFLLVGSLPGGAGGAILAHGLPRAELEAQVNEDPFVEHGVVHAEIVEISPNLADERLKFLVAA